MRFIGLTLLHFPFYEIARTQEMYSMKNIGHEELRPMPQKMSRREDISILHYMLALAFSRTQFAFENPIYLLLRIPIASNSEPNLQNESLAGITAALFYILFAQRRVEHSCSLIYLITYNSLASNEIRVLYFLFSNRTLLSDLPGM